MSKVGLVLFVKNEAEDIVWWISWHLSIGFDSIIVYDDYSSDGTWEILQVIASEYDVRPRRAIQSLRFNHRQALTYMSALDELRNEFDWLLYLDTDEYLDIINGEDVKTFLSMYDESIDGIALHWKCFGSNNHVEKPPTPNVFNNYFMHSLKEFELNQCVKSFFRPKNCNTKYINPHRFDVYGRYITVDGNDINWQEQHDERPISPPVWEKAVIRHFIIRSAEHFVEKSKRRSDIRSARIGIGLFNAYDKNEIYDKMSDCRVDAMIPYLYKIQNSVEKKFFLNGGFNIKTEIPYTNDKFNMVSIIHPITKINSVIVVEKKTGRVFHAKPDYDKNLFSPVIIFTISKFPKKAFITVADEIIPLFIQDDPRISTVLSFDIVDIQEGTFALKNPLTAKVLSFLQPENEKTINEVECNRDWTDAWETLILEFEEKENINKNIVYISEIISMYNDYDFFKETNLEKSIFIDSAISAFAVSLNKNENININSLPWLKKDRFLSL
ncbi:glycosyltransferase family 2 protein [Acetobacter thailandicus]|uniref:glycosyltransferase family 2 protein n=1 Tax=Acetobacter thailandicus TaxID=1502842 RepID=UPI001BAD0C96|nr:glycosyltransferase family 2 protein [Acetobacter thailandicus]MBS0987062.1 glycosyltransferase family 2 protein [Acetobacter thailandicus]